MPEITVDGIDYNTKTSPTMGKLNLLPAFLEYK